MLRLTEDEYRALLNHGTAERPRPGMLTSKTDRYRSATERRYAVLLDGWKHDGSVVQWWYEPLKGLYLAPSTSYSPDFLIQFTRQSVLELHEVKGAFIREKDWVKAKQAAALYPCFRFQLAQWKQGVWHWKEIPAR